MPTLASLAHVAAARHSPCATDRPSVFPAWRFSKSWDRQTNGWMQNGQTDARPLHTRYLLNAASGKQWVVWRLSFILVSGHSCITTLGRLFTVVLWQWKVTTEQEWSTFITMGIIWLAIQRWALCQHRWTAVCTLEYRWCYRWATGMVTSLLSSPSLLTSHYRLLKLLEITHRVHNSATSEKFM